MKKILMVAFHYPPYSGGSGIHRTLKFSRYLPDHGWYPIILSANPRAYSQVSGDRLDEISDSVPVTRAFAIDTARHLSIRGSYPKWMAVPDRWISWWPAAVTGGLRLVREYRPDIIWSTYPIATAHLIGLTLHRLTSIPWIADFRDSMTENDYPRDPVVRRVYRWVERLTVKHCTRAIFTTPGALRMYAERYPEIHPSRWALIANGYDEESFIAAEQVVMNRASCNGLVVLVHSGLLYTSDRDPRAFFAALAELRQTGTISSSNLRIILRASGDEAYYRQHLKESGIEDIVFLESPLGHREALLEMLAADGLLLFQGTSCNHQVPAKIYEYLRSRRPILALTDPQGDTAAVLKAAGVDTIIPMDSQKHIRQGLLDFLIQLREGRAPLADPREIARHSRQSRTEELAGLLNAVNADS